jgi:hypothetical protein
MTIFEMIFDPLLANQGVRAISLVEHPAIESNFIALKADETPVKLAAVPERRVVMGAVLIPDKPILRNDPKTQEDFYIYFSTPTVESIAEHFLLRGMQGAATLEHEKQAKGITLVESWIVVDPEKDKAAFYNLSVPAGTWMAALKVEDDTIWNDFIKTGELKGFSIEGYFGMELRDIEMSKTPEKKKTVNEMLEEMADQFI